jgi:hypothetical protein
MASVNEYESAPKVIGTLHEQQNIKKFKLMNASRIVRMLF